MDGAILGVLFTGRGDGGGAYCSRVADWSPCVSGPARPVIRAG
jgi:hypothetical protein